MSPRRYLPILILAGIVIAVQVAASLLGVQYYLTQLTMSAYYALVVVGLCLLMGYAGQISIGHAGFFAIGGYTSATLTTLNLQPMSGRPFVELLDGLGVLLRDTNIYGEKLLYLSPWVAFVLAVVVTACVATLIGIPVLKLKGHYLAMATLGFSTIIYRIVLGTHVFGEADGITGIPAFTLVPGLAVSGSFSARVSNYYIAWLVVIFGLVAAINLIGSRVGRGLRALHGSEEGALAMGVNTSVYKVRVFVISAVFASVAGVFLTHYNGGIGPSEASVMKSVRYVAIVAAGGMANLWGTLVTGTVLTFLSLRGVFGSYDDAVFGTILISIMLFAPRGLLRRELWHRVRPLLAERVAPALRSVLRRRRI